MAFRRVVALARDHKTIQNAQPNASAMMRGNSIEFTQSETEPCCILLIHTRSQKAAVDW
jgi:hypothetical protein